MDITLRILNKVTDTQGMHHAVPSDILFRSNVTNFEAIVQIVRFNSSYKVIETSNECFPRKVPETVSPTSLQTNIRSFLRNSEVVASMIDDIDFGVRQMDLKDLEGFHEVLLLTSDSVSDPVVHLESFVEYDPSVTIVFETIFRSEVHRAGVVYTISQAMIVHDIGKKLRIVRSSYDSLVRH